MVFSAQTRLLWITLGLFAVCRPALAQLGTVQSNVSSNDTSHMTYVSQWRSSIINGTYEAYSNYTDAVVTFRWNGVGASYVAIKGPNRGLCQLKLDDSAVYSIDLYNDSGYTQDEEVIWTSPTLPYGSHNVSISQVGEDARLG